MSRWADYRRAAHDMEPGEEIDLPGAARAFRRAQSIVSFVVLDVNDWLVRRTPAGRQARWDAAELPWTGRVEAAVPAIRDEIERYLATAPLPHVAAMSGLVPDSEKGVVSLPGIIGVWRTMLIFANGRWIEETAHHFPRTVAAFAELSPKANVGFSVLEPHSHILPHADANRGALRCQFPLIVPGEPGDCALRVGTDEVPWRVGEAVVFDLAAVHEAWNRTDHPRVLVMVEVPTPLPRPWCWTNRVGQLAYRWHPSYRQMPARVAAFGREHDAAAASQSAERV